jgi:tetratricopeptide (TPR) repeat protein
MNSRFERLAALDNQQALGGDVLGEVLAAVRKLAPGLVAAAPTLQTGPTRRAQSVAVVDWHPSGAAAGRAAVTEWLATLLAEGLSNRGMDVVERERVSAAGYEMDRAVWSSRQAVQYGRILAADLLLRGRWEETAGGWYGVWNVVAGRTGEFLGAGCIRAESPEALAAGVAQRTVEVTELPVPGAGTPLWQVIDTLAASMHRSAENVTSRHPLTTPVNPLGEVAIEAEIGALCYRSGQLGRAETHLRRALAGTYCDRVQVCRMLSEIYRSKGRHAEDLHLWRQEYEQAKRDPFDDARRARTTVLRYAEALLANGAHDEAAKVLPEFYSYAPGLASSHRTARLGKLFGEIGMSRARVKTYLSDSSLWYASKSLGELQKSLMMKDGRIRKHILSEFACDTKAPYQALRALEELDSQGSLAPPVLYAGLVAALIVYDYDAADRYARRLLQFSGASILVDDQLHDMLAGLPDNDLDAERQAYLRAVLTCFETVTSRRRAFMPGEAAAAVSLCRSHISRASALLKVPGREPYEKLPSLFKIGNALLWVRGTSVNRTEQSPLWVFAEHRQGACAGFDVAPQGIGRVRWVHYHRGGIRRRYPYNSLPDRRSFTEPATEALMCQGRVITAARSDGVIRALDPETGRTLWKYTAWGPIYDLAVHEDRVFAAILPYALLVLDGDTGNCLAFLPFPEFVGSRRRRLPALKVSDDGGLVALGQAVEVSVELDSFAVRFRPAPAQDAEISWGSMSEEQKIIAIREPAEVPPVDAVWLMQTAGNAAEPLTVRQIAFAALHKCLTRGYEGPVTTFVWEAACDSSWPNSLRESALRDLVWASPTAARDSALVMLEEGNRSLLRTALTVAAQAEPVTWERAVGLARAAMSENSNTRESERDQLEGYIWYNVKRTSNGFPFSPSLGWTEAALEKLASTKLAEKGGIRRNSSLWKALCRNGSRLIPDEWEESHGLVLDRDSGTYSLPEGWREDRFSETDFLEKVAELGDPRVLPAVNAILRDSVQRAPNAGVNSHGTRERAVYEALAAIGAAETVGDILQLISDYGTVPEPASALELLTFLTGRSFPTTYEWCLWYGHTP